MHWAGRGERRRHYGGPLVRNRGLFRRGRRISRGEKLNRVCAVESKPGRAPRWGEEETPAWLTFDNERESSKARRTTRHKKRLRKKQYIRGHAPEGRGAESDDNIFEVPVNHSLFSSPKESSSPPGMLNSTYARYTQRPGGGGREEKTQGAAHVRPRLLQRVAEGKISLV